MRSNAAARSASSTHTRLQVFPRAVTKTACDRVLAASGPAGTHTTGIRTGPPTRAPARAAVGPAAPGRRSRESRARAAFLRFRDVNPPDGPGLHAAAPCWSQEAISIFSLPASTILPSTPAVLRPALTLRHLPHAQQRVRPGAEHQLLQIADLLRSPALLAVKIRCRSRRTSSSTAPPSIGVPVENIVLRSVHHRRCRGVQLALRFRRLRSPSSSQAHLTHVSSLSGRATARIRPVIRDHRRRGRPASRFPAAFRLPAFASWVILRPLGS